MKPSDRIKIIAEGFIENYPVAIMIYLDEQSEKEQASEYIQKKIDDIDETVQDIWEMLDAKEQASEECRTCMLVREGWQWGDGCPDHPKPQETSEEYEERKKKFKECLKPGIVGCIALIESLNETQESSEEKNDIIDCIVQDIEAEIPFDMSPSRALEIVKSYRSKPQEEPKCDCCDGECNHDDCCGKVDANCKTNCPCHKESELPKNRHCRHESGTEGNCSKCGESQYPEKESESKEKWDTKKPARDIQRETLYPNQKESDSGVGLFRGVVFTDHIHLERPKGMSIGEAYVSFKDWYQKNAEYAHHFGDISDENWNKLWQEWRNSVEK